MYEMKPEYYIGIDMIDEEHKQLFQYADEAYELLHNDMIPDKFDAIHDVLMNLRNYTLNISVMKRNIWNLFTIRSSLHKRYSIRNLSINWMNLWRITTKK